MEHMSIWIVNLHGLWCHSTLCIIHMDTNMDMDTEFISVVLRSCILNFKPFENFNRIFEF